MSRCLEYSVWLKSVPRLQRKRKKTSDAHPKRHVSKSAMLDLEVWYKPMLAVYESLSAPYGLHPPPASWSLPSGGWCFPCWLLAYLSAQWFLGSFSSLLLPISPLSSVPIHQLRKQKHPQKNKDSGALLRRFYLSLSHRYCDHEPNNAIQQH